MADNIRLQAPTVEQQIVINISGEEKLRSFADTLDKISNNKNIQKYWKTQQELINATANAYGNFQKRASKDNATELIKVTNALKAMSGTDLSNILPDFDKISNALTEAQKVAGNIDSAFSVKGFKEAFDSFETLKAYSEDIEKILSHFGVSSNVSELQSNVRLLEEEVSKLTNRLSRAKNANEELRNEFENYKSGSGIADKLNELDDLKYELNAIREQAEETFRQFLELNNISENGYDQYGNYDSNRFSKYFDNIRSGSMTASDAIREFKSEYAYLLEESAKGNNSTFGIEQLETFSDRLDSIFRQVEETSRKINDIISNGVITKSVENLSTDTSLSNSQRSFFENILKDEDSLKNIESIIKKLIEESNNAPKIDLFNEEQLQQILPIFSNIESCLSSLKKTISDVGDGEEFSPLLKMINNVQSEIANLSKSVSDIKLNVNMDLGSEVSERLNQKVAQSTSRQLEAYRKLFSAMKSTGKTNKEMFSFYEPEDTNTSDLIGLYKEMISRAEKQFATTVKVNGRTVKSNAYKDRLGDEYLAYKKEIENATRQLSRAETKRSDSSIFKQLFGGGDLTEVISYLDKIAVKLEEISGTASKFNETFQKGFNVTASVEEIEKLTNRVRELEDELSKIKSIPVDSIVNKSNISSGNEEPFQTASSSAKELEEEIDKITVTTDKAGKSLDEYKEKWKILKQVGDVGDDKYSATFKRNEGQIESVTWKAQKDAEGNVLFDDDGNKIYDQLSVTISNYKELEKVIVGADNKLRQLEDRRNNLLQQNPKASTTGIDAQIAYQREYIELLEQTVKNISQADEYLLEEKQIIEARNKAEKEYNLAKGSKQDETQANAEKKRLANIEQVNRALNKQQIAIDSIEKTYNKSVNPDLDREVSNQQDLVELANKKSQIQAKINSLQGQKRTSANEKEFLELEKLIAEYKELAKYKLKSNNPSKQELGGQNLQTLIQTQISLYDKLIIKAEQYGEETSDVVSKLKEQREILSKIDSTGKYTATADQYYTSRDTYKVEKAGLSAYEAEVKVVEKQRKAAEQQQKAIKAAREAAEKRAKINRATNQSETDKAAKEQLSAYEKIKKLKFEISKTTDADTLSSLKSQLKIEQDRYLNAAKILKANSDYFDKDAQDLKITQARLEAEEKIAKYKADQRENQLSSIQNSVESYLEDYKKRNNGKPVDKNRSQEYQQLLDKYKASIDALQAKKDELSKQPTISEDDWDSVKKMTDAVEENKNALIAMSAAEKGSTEGSRRKEIDKITKYLKDNTRISEEAKTKLKEYLDLLRNGGADVNVDEIHNGFLKVTEAERLAGNEGKRFLDVIRDKAWYGWAAQIASYFSLQDIIRYFKEGATVVKEFDDGLTNISYTMDVTKSQLDGIGQSVLDLSKDLKSSIDNSMQVAKIYANMNTTAEEIKKLSEPTLIMSNLTGFDASTMADDIQAVTQQFEIAAEDSMHIADVYDTISRNISVDYSKILELTLETM